MWGGGMLERGGAQGRGGGEERKYPITATVELTEHAIGNSGGCSLSLLVYIFAIFILYSFSFSRTFLCSVYKILIHLSLLVQLPSTCFYSSFSKQSHCLFILSPVLQCCGSKSGPDLDLDFDFDGDPDPTFNFIADPDTDPTTLCSSDLDPPMLQNDPLRLPLFNFGADPDPAFHFDADTDLAFQNDAAPCGSRSGSATLLSSLPPSNSLSPPFYAQKFFAWQ